jgi:hypothetical protein
MKLLPWALSLILTASPLAAEPEKIIFDNDVGAGEDGAGALGVLHALLDAGEIEVLALGIVNSHPNAVPYVDAVNTWYGRPNLPIGVIKLQAPVHKDVYMGAVFTSLPRDLTADQAPDVVTLYRQALAAQPDKSVTLVAGGAPTNIVDLLNSPADAISPLKGRELIEKKVKLYVAGGNGDLPTGKYGQNYRNARDAARQELDQMPESVPMIFAGCTADKVKVGACVLQLPENNPIRKSYEESMKLQVKDCPAWDQVLLLYAARPALRDKWTLSRGGDIRLLNKDRWEWTAEPARGRSFAKVKEEKEMEKLLSDLMCQSSRE